MLYPIYLIKDAGIRLKALKNIAEKSLKNPEKFRPNDLLPKIYSAINDARSGVSELYFGAEKKNEYRLLNQLLSMSAQTFAREGEHITLDLLLAELEQLASMFDEVDEKTPEYCLRYDFKYSYEPFYKNALPVSEKFFRQFADSMTPLNRSLSVMFYKDSDGLLPFEMRKAFASDKAVFYGANLPDSLDDRARSRYDKVALGSMRGGSITNNAFDMLVLSPRAKLSINPSDFTIEKSAIVDGIRSSLKYLRVNGYVVFSLPFFRLSREVCAYLSRTFDDIQLLRPDDGYDPNSGQAYFIGRKKDRTLDTILSNDVSNSESYNFLREAAYNINLATPLSEMRSFALPFAAIPVTSYTGSIMDTEELLQIEKASSATPQFWNDNTKQLQKASDRRPLLPFNDGQLGLVTCSGSLDGVVEELGNCCHLVKGRVVKYTEVETTQEGENKTSTSTTESNRVEINIITPDGEHKVLA